MLHETDFTLYEGMTVHDMIIARMVNLYLFRLKKAEQKKLMAQVVNLKADPVAVDNEQLATLIDAAAQEELKKMKYCMDSITDHWASLDFKFDGICSGYMGNISGAEYVTRMPVGFVEYIIDLAKEANGQKVEQLGPEPS